MKIHAYLEIIDISLDILVRKDYNEIKKLDEKNLEWLLYLVSIYSHDKE